MKLELEVTLPAIQVFPPVPRRGYELNGIARAEP
jgi:hypothetical protein